MNEDDDEVVVGIRVLSGDLSRTVIVGFTTDDDSATSTGITFLRIISNLCVV